MEYSDSGRKISQTEDEPTKADGFRRSRRYFPQKMEDFDPDQVREISEEVRPSFPGNGFRK